MRTRANAGRYLGLLRQALSLLLSLSCLCVEVLGQTTVRVSVDWKGDEVPSGGQFPAISADGRFVAFETLWPLVPTDTNNNGDVYLYELATGIVEQISVSSTGQGGDGWSLRGSISADGRYVAFVSTSTNLVPGDTNGTTDAFLRDRLAGTTVRVSVDSTGGQGDGPSRELSTSADGRFVAFASLATNLVPGDTNGVEDVFAHDVAAGTTERISVSSGGGQGDGRSMCPSVSGDGRYVSFTSSATNLVPGETNQAGDVFVRDRLNGTTVRASVDSNGEQHDAYSASRSRAISADGRTVVFESKARFDPIDTDWLADIYVRDLEQGITELVSASSNGQKGNSASHTPSISAGGRHVVFWSGATNLVQGDTNRRADAFLHDRSSGVTIRPSLSSTGTEGNDDSGDPTVSGEGRYVAFHSLASNLVPGDTNSQFDAFVRDICSTATWSNYGQGFPGTHGIPSFTASADPVLGTTILLPLESSLGRATIALLILGTAEASIPTSWGGTLLAEPEFLLPLSLPRSGISLPAVIPNDISLCGLSFYLQALERDPGAALGVSFTAGLKLVPGL